MKDAEKIEQRLTDLEIKASFNEDLLDQLNQVIVRQQQQLDALVREVSHLRLQSAQTPSGGLSQARDELPPHY
jgi:SlyX protein